MGKKDPDEKSTSKDQNFEAKLTDLEKIVRELESGKVNLEESLQEFEKGVNLYKDCKQLLNKIEKKIKVLTDDLDEEEYHPEK